MSISIEEKNLHDLHIAEKLAMREEKNKENTNENCLLVVFESRKPILDYSSTKESSFSII